MLVISFLKLLSILSTCFLRMLALYGFNQVTFSNPNDVTPNDNIRDYLLFASNSNIPINFTNCIVSSEMNFHYNGLYQIVGTNFSNSQPYGRKPVGKDFLASNLAGDLILIDNNGSSRFQVGLISFGVPHFCWVAEPCDPFSNCYLECD